MMVLRFIVKASGKVEFRNKLHKNQTGDSAHQSVNWIKNSKITVYNKRAIKNNNKGIRH